MAFVGAVAVLAWLVVYEALNKFLWENELILANPWLFPAICLPFSLLVGLLVKYRHAPTTLDESLLDSLAGDPTKIDWRALPVNVAHGLGVPPLGAVLGPEGGIGGIGSKIAVAVRREGRDPRRAPLAARLLDPRLRLQRPHREPAVHRRPRHRADR